MVTERQINEMWKRLKGAAEGAGNWTDFKKYVKESMAYTKASLRGENDGRHFPEWASTVKMMTWKEFELAMIILESEGYDKKWVQEILDEEKEHVSNLEGHEKVIFLLRFYKDAKGRVHTEPATRIMDEEIEKSTKGRNKFAKKIGKALKTKTQSKWDRELERETKI